MLKYIISILILSVAGIGSNFDAGSIEEFQDKSVSEVLMLFGESMDDKKPDLSISGVSARVGENIVRSGFSKEDGLRKSKRQSRHFVCTSCHNLEREDPNLALDDPEARLSYTNEKGLPFLQATTLYGAVNRDSYYNGDYEKKYGELIKPARYDLREAIQLCATECAQGRPLQDWEMESIVAYLWELELKISDLGMTDIEIESLESAVKNNVLKEEGVKFIKSKYLSGAGATFVDPPADRKSGTGYPGDADNGKLIYENSCLHCHYQKRYSFLHLDNNKMSFKHLDSKADEYSRHSIYQVVRYGTYSKYGKKSYMPNYTLEKMSDQQLADLREYISTQANL